MSTQPAPKAKGAPAPAAAAAPATPTPANPETAPKEKKEKKAKLPKIMVRLVDAQKNTLRFTAKQRADGTAISFATHSVRDAEGKPTRTKGANGTHPNLDEAKKAIEAGVEAAKKIGWSAKGKTVRISKDSFDLSNLPTPAAAAPAAPAPAPTK